jgi:hypothetical protein
LIVGANQFPKKSHSGVELYLEIAYQKEFLGNK